MIDDEQHPQQSEYSMHKSKSSRGGGEASVQTNATEVSNGEEQRKMATEYQATPEEEAYGRLLEEKWELLSEAARTMANEARLAAYATYMVHGYCGFQQEEYEEAMEKMRVAAAELSGHECELLAKLWRAALAAAASIDSEDFETLAGYRVYSGDLHWYYRMLSGIVEKILEEKRLAELQKEHAECELEGISDIPF
jgi:hypothetical protein